MSDIKDLKPPTKPTGENAYYYFRAVGAKAWGKLTVEEGKRWNDLVDRLINHNDHLQICGQYAYNFIMGGTDQPYRTITIDTAREWDQLVQYLIARSKAYKDSLKPIEPPTKPTIEVPNPLTGRELYDKYKGFMELDWEDLPLSKIGFWDRLVRNIRRDCYLNLEPINGKELYKTLSENGDIGWVTLSIKQANKWDAFAKEILRYYNEYKSKLPATEVKA